jgi:hypothetical protein
MQTRVKMSLDHDWQFVRRRAAKAWLSSAADGRDIDLPHCWNEQDAFQEGVEYYRGWGSYRKAFRLDRDLVADGCRWRLVSEGFYGTGDVWLNGRRLGKVDGQYLGFAFDVTGVFREEGENLIGVRLTNRCSTAVLPGIKMPDFLLYGGLSGRLWLERIPAVSINSSTVRVDGGFGWTAAGAPDAADVRIDCEVDGPGAESCELTWRVLDAEGGVRCESRATPVTQARNRQQLSLPDPRRWDVDDPYLYSAEGSLLCNGSVVDVVSIRFGVRSAEFRPDEGFFLNGRRLPLRGCNRHESMPGFGRALPLWMHREDAERIKSMGLNFVRLSHYPQHPAFLDACDELGILVYAEVASWKSVRGGRWLKHACRQMCDMILRDRNHPSVILWGMGNEGRHLGAYQRLYAICKELDASRAVTYAENHLYRARRRRTLGVPDVWGTNYEFAELEAGRDASRLRCVVVSECSNYPHTERGDDTAEAKQLATLKRDVEELEGRSFVSGFALWCFNDYATLRKQRYKRYSGIVDAWRVPKVSAHWLASRYGGSLEPGLSLSGEEPSAIVLRPERTVVSGSSRETVGVEVAVTDAEGRRCDWHGSLTTSVSGGGRLRSFDAAGTVVVGHGVGRLFVTANGDEAPVRVTVVGAGLASDTVEIVVN